MVVTAYINCGHVPASMRGLSVFDQPNLAHFSLDQTSPESFYNQFSEKYYMQENKISLAQFLFQFSTGYRVNLLSIHDYIFRMVDLKVLYKKSIQ